jgi:hypothetical protein
VSQAATEAPASPSSAPGKRENVFTRRIGPLPMWVWLLVGAAVIGGYVLLKRRAGGGPAGGTTSAGQVPQFVNQVYTSPGPPVAPGPVPSPVPSPVPVPVDKPKTVPLKHVGKGKVRIGSPSDLYFLAKQLGVSYDALVKANPALRKFEGTGKGVPSGTTINVPGKGK